MHWHFKPLPRLQVATEVTQRDQFDNDDVRLADTLIREPIQNSLDASLADCLIRQKQLPVGEDLKAVKMVFRWVKPVDTIFFKRLFERQIQHAELAKINVDTLDFKNPCALVIEDFGTTGLLGSTVESDEGDFAGFWRRHGQSDKHGAHRGRHGLGKLVYSCASELGVFFGVTRRLNDSNQYLMGHTVLNLRKLDGRDYPPHAYFSNLEHENSDDPLAVPFCRGDLIEKFCENFSINRSSEPGLSVVIPFPKPAFEIEKMIGIAISNYYYAILTSKLELKFNDVEVNSQNVRSLAKIYADHLKDVDGLFNFVCQLSDLSKRGDSARLKETWVDGPINKNDFESGGLKGIQNKFSSGELVAIRLPVSVALIDQNVLQTEFMVFLQKPSGLVTGQDIYVRGGLTLPSESKFKSQIALSAMIAEESSICELIGDAENPAHTKMLSNAEKLRTKYKDVKGIILSIKNSLIQLYDVIADIDKLTDDSALYNFFNYSAPNNDSELDKKKKKSKRTVVDIISKPRLFNVSRIDNGFTVSSADTFNKTALPREVTVYVAYDRSKGSPFKKYSPHDFVLGDSPINIECENLSKTEILQNKLKFTVDDLPFKLSVTGFDSNRDLKIKVQ